MVTRRIGATVPVVATAKHHVVVGPRHLLQPGQVLEVARQGLLAELVEVDVAHDRLQAPVLDELQRGAAKPVTPDRCRGVEPRATAKR